MPTLSGTITPQHINYLVAIAGDHNPAIPPMMRKKLVRLGLLRAVDPPRAPRNTPGRQRAPKPRRHQVTEAGMAVIARATQQGGATCEH